MVLLAWFAALPVLAGCGTPECREVPPVSERREEVVESMEDKLDDADLSDEQLKKMKALVHRVFETVPELRETTLPAIRAAVRELKARKPDRARLQKLIGHVVDAYADYARQAMPVVLGAREVLSARQRKQAADAYEEPDDDDWDRSWTTERAYDYFLALINATSSQRQLFARIKEDMQQRNRAYQKQMQQVRKELGEQFVADKPNMKRLHALIDQGATHSKAMVYDLVGYYLLFVSRLELEQRRIINRQLIRLEPCPT